MSRLEAQTSGVVLDVYVPELAGQFMQQQEQQQDQQQQRKQQQQQHSPAANGELQSQAVPQGNPGTSSGVS